MFWFHRLDTRLVAPILLRKLVSNQTCVLVRVKYCHILELTNLVHCLAQIGCKYATMALEFYNTSFDYFFIASQIMHLLKDAFLHDAFELHIRGELMHVAIVSPWLIHFVCAPYKLTPYALCILDQWSLPYLEYVSGHQ